MTFEQQMTLLLIGAGIALVSSLASIATTSLVSYRLSRKARLEERKEQLRENTGRMIVLANQLKPTGKSSTDLVKLADELAEISGEDAVLVDMLIGATKSLADLVETALKDYKGRER